MNPALSPTELPSHTNEAAFKASAPRNERLIKAGREPCQAYDRRKTKEFQTSVFIQFPALEK
jgi:hypothetical protein